MTKHKHYKEIVAWAEGEKIQQISLSGIWVDQQEPEWDEENEFRVKKKPNVALPIFVTRWIDINKIDMYGSGSDNVKFSFDGETNELISVEMIK